MNSYSPNIPFNTSDREVSQTDQLLGNELTLTLDNTRKSSVNSASVFEAKASPRLNKSAFSNLSAVDQVSFQSFALGPSVELPFHFLHHAFEHWVAKQPNNIAAEYQGEKITYSALNQKADQLSAKLIEKGVQAGDKVGLFVKRSVDMLVAMIAILKTGAAYVPLDVGVVPSVQMGTIIESANLKVVLSFKAYLDKIPQTSVNSQIIAIDNVSILAASKADWYQIAAIKAEQGAAMSTNNCAFVLFTSGTTGKPNGVQVSHKNLCNILLTTPGNMMIGKGVKVSQILNIGFDMSAWEIWGTLCNGGHLVIRGKSITEAVKKADVVIATPSILSRLDLEQVLPIKAAAVAGEPCPRPLADSWANVCAFYNSCGPTETTIINTAQRHYPESKLLSIGSPTPNNSVYILDEHLKPCAIGETGEMWAGGDCVSLGYIGNRQLTNERYRPDPFLGNGRLMFRTRDLGRWTKEGQLEHLGRTDDQVKVRGFRVELDAVSNLLECQQHCERAVTLKLNNRDLIAFVMPEDIDTAMARQALAKQLPYYSVPEHIIALEKLPLTDRGKVDKRLLQERFFDQVASLVPINSGACKDQAHTKNTANTDKESSACR